jgi:hypothetical protein
VKAAYYVPISHAAYGLPDRLSDVDRRLLHEAIQWFHDEREAVTEGLPRADRKDIE